jgi:hypothetical protein
MDNGTRQNSLRFRVCWRVAGGEWNRRTVDARGLDQLLASLMDRYGDRIEMRARPL